MRLVCFFARMCVPRGRERGHDEILDCCEPRPAPSAPWALAEVGLSGIWFGILMVKKVEIVLITPPVGINVYGAAGAASGLSIEEAFKGVWPFGLMDIITVALLFAFPGPVTFLPERIAG